MLLSEDDLWFEWMREGIYGFEEVREGGLWRGLEGIWGRRGGGEECDGPGVLVTEELRSVVVLGKGERCGLWALVGRTLGQRSRLFGNMPFVQHSRFVI